MLRFADGQPDLLEAGGRLDVRDQLAQLLEGVGVELRQMRIHGDFR